MPDKKVSVLDNAFKRFVDTGDGFHAELTATVSVDEPLGVDPQLEATMTLPKTSAYKVCPAGATTVVNDGIRAGTLGDVLISLQVFCTTPGTATVTVVDGTGDLGAMNHQVVAANSMVAGEVRTISFGGGRASKIAAWSVICGTGCSAIADHYAI